MILPAYFADLAAKGKATVGLVPIAESRKVIRGGKVGWKVPRPGKGTDYDTVPWTPREGSHETLRTGRRAIADIVIGPSRKIHLADLLEDDTDTLALVRATGCKTRTELAREWMRHTDKNWPPTVEDLCTRCAGHNTMTVEWTNPITNVTYVTTMDCPHCDEVGTVRVPSFPTGHEILKRFRRKYGHRQVYLVHFALDGVEHHRLLSPAGRPRGDDLGYTENPSDAIEDAGEAVPVTYQAQISKDAAASLQTERDRKIKAGELADLDSTRLARNAARAARHRAA